MAHTAGKLAIGLEFRCAVFKSERKYSCKHAWQSHSEVKGSATQGG